MEDGSDAASTVINPAESNAIFFNTVYPCDPSSGEMNSSKSPHAKSTTYIDQTLILSAQMQSIKMRTILILILLGNVADFGLAS
jgi:hypothetical protein